MPGMTHRAAMLAPLVAFVVAAAPVEPAGSPPGNRAPASSARPAAPRQILPWIEDDWTRAVATAKARKLPIFVESWAPW